jgi:PfaB family protein
VRAEFAELVRQTSFPTQPLEHIHLFSAATYAPVEFDSQIIANDIAEALCSCLDFERLVNQVYADGARIFIELGAGSNCTRWVDESLKGQPHAAAAISRKGSTDLEALLRLLARLASHRVPLDISSLYQA